MDECFIERNSKGMDERVSRWMKDLMNGVKWMSGCVNGALKRWKDGQMDEWMT